VVYVLMVPMYPTMTSGKVDKFLVDIGDKVGVGMPVAEIISEGYFTLVSEYRGIVKEFYVGEDEYVESDTPIIGIEEEIVDPNE
jgi:pyruvate/2-oxoglutarate dehydrogenase complex dihydrolipoamide acyltransferase (E2) component